MRSQLMVPPHFAQALGVPRPADSLIPLQNGVTPVCLVPLSTSFLDYLQSSPIGPNSYPMLVTGADIVANMGQQGAPTMSVLVNGNVVNLSAFDPRNQGGGVQPRAEHTGEYQQLNNAKRESGIRDEKRTSRGSKNGGMEGSAGSGDEAVLSQKRKRISSGDGAMYSDSGSSCSDLHRGSDETADNPVDKYTQDSGHAGSLEVAGKVDDIQQGNGYPKQSIENAPSGALVGMEKTAQCAKGRSSVVPADLLDKIPPAVIDERQEVFFNQSNIIVGMSMVDNAAGAPVAPAANGTAALTSAPTQSLTPADVDIKIEEAIKILEKYEKGGLRHSLTGNRHGSQREAAPHPLLPRVHPSSGSEPFGTGEGPSSSSSQRRTSEDHNATRAHAGIEPCKKRRLDEQDAPPTQEREPPFANSSHSHMPSRQPSYGSYPQHDQYVQNNGDSRYMLAPQQNISSTSSQEPGPQLHRAFDQFGNSMSASAQPSWSSGNANSQSYTRYSSPPEPQHSSYTTSHMPQEPSTYSNHGRVVYAGSSNWVPRPYGQSPSLTPSPMAPAHQPPPFQAYQQHHLPDGYYPSRRHSFEQPYRTAPCSNVTSHTSTPWEAPCAPFHPPPQMCEPPAAPTATPHSLPAPPPPHAPRPNADMYYGNSFGQRQAYNSNFVNEPTNASAGQVNGFYQTRQQNIQHIPECPASLQRQFADNRVTGRAGEPGWSYVGQLRASTQAVHERQTQTHFGHVSAGGDYRSGGGSVDSMAGRSARGENPEQGRYVQVARDSSSGPSTMVGQAAVARTPAYILQPNIVAPQANVGQNRAEPTRHVQNGGAQRMRLGEPPRAADGRTGESTQIVATLGTGRPAGSNHRMPAVSTAAKATTPLQQPERFPGCGQLENVEDPQFAAMYHHLRRQELFRRQDEEEEKKRRAAAATAAAATSKARRSPDIMVVSVLKKPAVRNVPVIDLTKGDDVPKDGQGNSTGGSSSQGTPSANGTPADNSQAVAQGNVNGGTPQGATSGSSVNGEGTRGGGNGDGNGGDNGRRESADGCGGGNSIGGERDEENVTDPNYEHYREALRRMLADSTYQRLPKAFHTRFRRSVRSFLVSELGIEAFESRCVIPSKTRGPTRCTFKVPKEMLVDYSIFVMDEIDCILDDPAATLGEDYMAKAGPAGVEWMEAVRGDIQKMNSNNI
ncbi:hypothetical protein HDU97_003591 [Phlyctochytrium planicorne]|nr:hypothetical protein HDU97_003591 [Phlyctochytrium planicorne]